MKDILNKVFDKKIVKPIFIGFGTFSIFTFIVFPGLTVANTAYNIVSAIIGLFTLVFVFYYLKGDQIYDPPTIEPGETELDYISPDELQPKKKSVKKKPVKKSEFPIEPHHTTKKVEPKKPVTTKSNKK
jgi:hypothetical protein